jgi:hypothetical protein
MNEISAPRRLTSIEEDYALWSKEQGALLRARKLDHIDIENIAEEIESLGKSQKREVESRLDVLVMHLLKWERQPEYRSRSWALTIKTQRRELARLFRDSPSLRSYPAEILADEYLLAREKASIETTIFLELFPSACPYSIEQILDETFLPGDL